MKPEYIGWTGLGKKRATTRLKPKHLGEYSLISGSYYKPIKSGCVIDVYAVVKWTLKAPYWFKFRIAEEEGFGSWEEFIIVLLEINKGKIDEDTILYTHYYHMIVPPKIQYMLKDKRAGQEAD